MYTLSGRFEDVNASRHTSNSDEEPIVAWCDTGESFLVRQFVLSNEGEIIEEVTYFLLLKDIIEYKLFIRCRDEQMLIIDLDIADMAIVGVDRVISYVGTRGVNHSDLGLSSYDNVVLDEVHSCDFLAVHINRK